MKKNILFVGTILLLPTLTMAALNQTRQIQPERKEMQKGVETKNGYGLENQYGYGPIDKNLEAKGYGYAFAYGQNKEKNGNAYGLQKKIEDNASYGYGKQKRVNMFTNVFTKIKNFFSFKNNK